MQTAVSKGWHLWAGDVSTAFLRGDKEEERNINTSGVEELRKKYGLQPDEILKLRKVAYGLVNAPRRWYERVIEDLLKLHWTPNPHDECVFMKFENDQLAGRLVSMSMISSSRAEERILREISKTSRTCTSGVNGRRVSSI